MLSFFRRIRKSLVDSASAKKYLLYAFGEIALVVIGILIALQINNWNESQKEQGKIRIHAKSLIQDLEEDLYTIKDNRDWINHSHKRSLRETEKSPPACEG